MASRAELTERTEHAEGCTDIHSLSGCTAPAPPLGHLLLARMLRKLYEYESDEKSTITCQGRFRPRAYEPHSRRPSDDDVEQCIVVKQQRDGGYPPAVPPCAPLLCSLRETHFGKAKGAVNGRSSVISICPIPSRTVNKLLLRNKRPACLSLCHLTNPIPYDKKANQSWHEI